MFSAMVSRRILGCLSLTLLLLQHGGASRSQHSESVIMKSLQRIENLIKQNQQNALTCIVPCEKLFNMASDLKNDGNEIRNQLIDSVIDAPHRRALMSSEEDEDSDILRLLQMLRPRRRRTSRNENTNSNTNTNVNTNANTNKARLFDVVSTERR